MDIGAFILGILFGWLAEWIYVNFFGSKSSSTMGDCSAYERELNTRNEEIKALKAELGVSSGAGASLMSSTAGNTASKSASAKSASKTAAESTSATKATTSTAKKTAGKATGAKKSTATTTKTKKSAAAKPAAKKPATKKATGKKIKGDDFTKLTGIGPSMSAKLKELGITTFDKLAAQEDDNLRSMLENAGARLNNNKEDMDTWNEQATLAAKGQFKELLAFQEKLKK